MATRQSQQEPEPLKQFIVPPYGTSPVTGVSGVLNWGGINRPDRYSRRVIGDAEFDDLINVLPQGIQLQQVPYKGANIAQLPSAVVWLTSEYFNGAIVLFALCVNGHIYQVTTAGVITDLPSATFSVNPPTTLTNWQGTNIIIADPAVQRIYSWDGATVTTVFTAQPNTSVMVFQNRLWIANGLTLTWTNIGTYNSLAGDSGNIIIIDDDAQSGIIQLLSFGGNLMLLGSNWIKTVSNLQDIGAPAVLSFNLTTLTNEVGVANRYSAVAIGNILYYANAYGIFQLAGSAPVKISSSVDGFYNNLNLSTSTFSAAYGIVFGIQCLFWHVYYNGDANEAAGHTLLGLTFVNNQPSQWFRVQQGDITFITWVTSAQLVDNLPIVYGTDSLNLFPLFGSVSTNNVVALNTKIWDIDGSKLNYKQFHAAMVGLLALNLISGTVGYVDDYGSVIENVSINVSPTTGKWFNQAGTQGLWFNTVGTTGTWIGSVAAAWFPLQFNAGFMRRGLGLNISLTGSGMIFHQFVLGYADTDASWGP